VTGADARRRRGHPEPPGLRRLLLLRTAADGHAAQKARAALLTAGHREWTPKRLRVAQAPRVGDAWYPPLHAFVSYPLALLPPQPAYRAQQLADVVLTLLAGLAVRQLSRGRTWWPVAVTGSVLFPGYLGSLALGQNAQPTLTVLLWGWVLIVRGRPGWLGRHALMP
jgi:hypothetical protein